MAYPIWKDYFVNFGEEEYVDYRLKTGTTIIYTGRAYRRPGATDVEVRINDIVADYFDRAVPGEGFTFDGYKVEIGVDKYNPDYDAWEAMPVVTFYNDWSYDYGFDPETMGLSFPINGRIDSRMPIVWTGYDESEITVRVYYRDGTSSFLIIPVEITADFNDDYNEDFALSLRSAGTGTALFYPSRWDDVERITVGDTEYRIVTDCARYALYYVNAHGGWDCLLMEGNDMETDALKRYTSEQVYDNRNISNRGTRNYVNEITKSFTLRTGWLLHDQGKMMHHLINSTEVFLYDIADDHMIPVIIPETSCEYKTYRNQGNRLVNYTIQVQVAQNRVRR